MKERLIVRTLLAATVVLLAAACGQKGPLRLPGMEGPAAGAITPPLATSPSRTVAP